MLNEVDAIVHVVGCCMFVLSMLKQFTCPIIQDECGIFGDHYLVILITCDG